MIDGSDLDWLGFFLKTVGGDSYLGKLFIFLACFSSPIWLDCWYWSIGCSAILLKVGLSLSFSMIEGYIGVVVGWLMLLFFMLIGLTINPGRFT